MNNLLVTEETMPVLGTGGRGVVPSEEEEEEEDEEDEDDDSAGGV